MPSFKTKNPNKAVKSTLHPLTAGTATAIPLDPKLLYKKIPPTTLMIPIKIGYFNRVGSLKSVWIVLKLKNNKYRITIIPK